MNGYGWQAGQTNSDAGLTRRTIRLTSERPVDPHLAPPQSVQQTLLSQIRVA